MRIFGCSEIQLFTSRSVRIQEATTINFDQIYKAYFQKKIIYNGIDERDI